MPARSAQIVRPEVRKLAQLVGLEQLDLAALPCNQSAMPQFLDGTIDVDDREPAGVRNVPLRHRNLETAVPDKADDLQPCGKFADEMRDLVQRCLRAEARDPLPRDRRVDQRLAPEGAGQVDRTVEKLVQLAVRDGADDGRTEPDEVRIHRRDQQGVQARHVAGHVEGDDLAAIGDDAGLVEEAADDET